MVDAELPVEGARGLLSKGVFSTVNYWEGSREFGARCAREPRESWSLVPPPEPSPRSCRAALSPTAEG